MYIRVITTHFWGTDECCAGDVVAYIGIDFFTVS